MKLLKFLTLTILLSASNSNVWTMEAKQASVSEESDLKKIFNEKMKLCFSTNALIQSHALGKIKHNILACDDNGNTLLHYASAEENGCLYANMLIRLGAAVDACNKKGKSPLDVAEETENIAVQDLLKINLHLLKCARNGVLEGVIDALEKRAYVNVSDSKGYTPLHNAAWKGWRSQDILRLLLSKGAKAVINKKTNDGSTPLHLAASDGYPDNITLLLDAGAKSVINVPDNDGETPLHCAARNGRARYAIPLLLAAEASVHSENKKKETPLHIASRNMDDDAFLLLVGAGADQSKRNSEGLTAAEVREKYLKRLEQAPRGPIIIYGPISL